MAMTSPEFECGPYAIEFSSKSTDEDFVDSVLSFEPPEKIGDVSELFLLKPVNIFARDTTQDI